MSRSYAILVIPFLLSLGISTNAAAQEAREPWRQTLEVGLVAAGIDGTVDSATVSGSGGFRHLRVGGMLAYRLERQKFAFLANLTALSVSAFTGTGDSVYYERNSVDARLRTFEVDYAPRMSRLVELIFGARMVSSRTTAEYMSASPGGGSADFTRQARNWVDPVIGIQIVAPLSKGLSFTLRGDASSFGGGGSSAASQVVVTFNVRVSPQLTVRLGYRSFDDNYEYDQFHGQHYRYDARTAGPMLSVAVAM
jgi:hypothetical protein